MCVVSCVRLFATPRTVTHQPPLSMEEYWSGLSFPFPGYLPNSVIELVCPALQVDSLPLSHQGFPYKVSRIVKCIETESMWVNPRGQGVGSRERVSAEEGEKSGRWMMVRIA